MQPAVFLDQHGCFRSGQLTEHFLTGFGIQVRVKAGDGRPEPPVKHHIAIAGPFGCGTIRADVEASGDSEAEFG